MSTLEQKGPGLVHLYAGDGKGKSTAAAGLALRAKGRGWRVLFCQFLKARVTGEMAVLEQVGVETLRAPASPKFTWELTQEEREDLTARLLAFLEVLRERMADYDLVILDEGADLTTTGFLSAEAFAALVQGRPESLELVITGHSPPREIQRLADYHTHFGCVAHPYQRQVPARVGIES